MTPFFGLHVLTRCNIFDSLLYRIGAVYSGTLAQPFLCCSGRTVLPNVSTVLPRTATSVADYNCQISSISRLVVVA